MPLYKQIHQSIRTAILNGELENNAALPFEEEIAEFYNVSRIAVRMAYEALANEGLIIRIKRRGTFVSKRPILTYHDHEVAYLKRMLESRGYTYNQRNLLVETIQAENNQYPDMLKDYGKSVLRITQSIQINHMPFALVEYFVPQNVNLYQVETIINSDDSLMAIDKILQLKITKIDAVYRGEKVRDIYAKSLGLTQDASVFHYFISYKDKNDHLKLFSSVVINGSTNILEKAMRIST